MNLISQHIREEEKEFDKDFDFHHKGCICHYDHDRKIQVTEDAQCKHIQLKSFLRSSSLSLVEKIIGQVRGKINLWENERKHYKLNCMDLASKQKNPDSWWKNYNIMQEYDIKIPALESIALLLEQGLEELKDNK